MNHLLKSLTTAARRRWAACMDWLIESQPLSPPATHGHLRRRLAPLHAAMRVHRSSDSGQL